MGGGGERGGWGGVGGGQLTTTSVSVGGQQQGQRAIGSSSTAHTWMLSPLPPTRRPNTASLAPPQRLPSSTHIPTPHTPRRSTTPHHTTPRCCRRRRRRTRLEHACQHADEGGLAGAILAKHHDDLAVGEAARLHLQGRVVRRGREAGVRRRRGVSGRAGQQGAAGGPRRTQAGGGATAPEAPQCC